MRERKWKDEFYVRAYELAKQGMKDKQIADSFDVSISSFMYWVENRPALKEALARGRKSGGGVADFKKFVVGRLDPEMREMFERMESDDPAINVEALEDARARGMRERQYMFFHAFIACNFVMTDAARKCGVEWDTVEVWSTRDRKFRKMMASLHQAKKDFFESALMDLVKARDPATVRFVNQSVNRDRGYGKSVEVNVTGALQVTNTISADDLTYEQKKELLQRLRERKREEAPRLAVKSSPNEDTVTDAEVV